MSVRRGRSLSRPTISVLCPTNHPGPLVAAIMERLRGTVDEIVIAADARADAEDLGWYATVADTLLRYEHFGANRHHSWLAEQAGGDWLLLLDGDELPGDGFVRALPDLAADRRIAQYSAPIHWPWPSAAERLVSEPWASDRRLRLIRNDGRTAFHGRKHALAYDEYPQRHLGDDLAVYHLDLLLPDVERRRAKALRYDRELFGLLTPEGRPLNTAFYVPEDEPVPRLVAVPERDRALLVAALAQVRAPAREPEPLDQREVPLADRAAVARRWAHVEVPPDTYAGAVEPAGPLPTFTAGGREHSVWVRVRNDGSLPWRWGLDRPPLFRLGVRWRTAGGETIDAPGRIPLPCTVEPGEDALAVVTVDAPPIPGRYELLVDLVHENVRWFGIGTAQPAHVGRSAAAGLDVLERRFGAVAPLDAVRTLRREAGRVDALVKDLVGTPRQHVRTIDDELRAIVGEPATAAPAEATLAALATIIRHERPTAVLELGSGTTTVLLSALLRELHGAAATGRLISLEQDRHWADVARHALAARGLDAVASVHHVPVALADGGSTARYVPTDAARAALDAAPPQLVLVDGPALRSGPSRLGAVETALPFVAVGGATLLLCDALCDAGLETAAAWSRRDEVTIEGVALIDTGLLIGRIPARRPLRDLLRRLAAR